MDAKHIAQELQRTFSFEYIGIHFGRFTTALGRNQHKMLVLPFWMFCAILGATCSGYLHIGQERDSRILRPALNATSPLDFDFRVVFAC